MMIEIDTFFAAPKAKVWDLLTDAAWTKQYMFGCEVLSTWEIDAPITWDGPTEDGQIITYVKGHILELIPGEKIVFTMFSPNAEMPDIPENYVNMSYEIKEVTGGTQFYLKQGDYSKAANGQSRYEESLKSWDLVLPAMKKLVEA